MNRETIITVRLRKKIAVMLWLILFLWLQTSTSRNIISVLRRICRLSGWFLKVLVTSAMINFGNRLHCKFKKLVSDYHEHIMNRVQMFIVCLRKNITVMLRLVWFLVYKTLTTRIIKSLVRWVCGNFVYFKRFCWYRRWKILEIILTPHSKVQSPIITSTSWIEKQ